MTIRLRAEDEPAKTRVDYWQHVVGGALAPYQLVAAGGSFRSQIHQAQIGPVTVLDFHISAARGIRTPDLIRQSDMGLYQVDLGIRGRARYEQDDRQQLLVPGDFHLIDLSRPSHVAIDTAHEVSVVMFPRERLPVRDRDLRALTHHELGRRSRPDHSAEMQILVPSGARGLAGVRAWPRFHPRTVRPWYRGQPSASRRSPFRAVRRDTAVTAESA